MLLTLKVLNQRARLLTPVTHLSLTLQATTNHSQLKYHLPHLFPQTIAIITMLIRSLCKILVKVNLRHSRCKTIKVSIYAYFIIFIE